MTMRVQLHCEAEDRADAEAFLAHEREPGEWKPWSALRDLVEVERKERGARRGEGGR